MSPAGSIIYGLFLRNNRSYLLKRRAPKNVERLYMRWCIKYFVNDVLMHFEEFRRVFPNSLRSSSKFKDSAV